MVSYRKTLFNKNRMPNTESHIYNNFQMGIFSRSSDRNGQFSVMFMLLHFLVYFSTVSFHSISVSLCLPYELSPASFHRLDLPMHGVFYCTHSYTCLPRTTLLLSLHLHSSVAFFLSLTQVRSGPLRKHVLLLVSFTSYCENAKPSNLINCCHPRPEKVYFK